MYIYNYIHTYMITYNYARTYNVYAPIFVCLCCFTIAEMYFLVVKYFSLHAIKMYQFISTGAQRRNSRNYLLLIIFSK